MTGLPRQRPHTLPRLPAKHRWLIDRLWGHQAVGIIGGEPKCCKSFLALDMAVSLASGTPCLGRYVTSKSGPVVLFAAEDALHIVRERIAGICAQRDIAIDEIDLWVITAPTVRLDLDDDRRRLTATVSEAKPVLLILDPFVRLHRVDENAAAEVAPLLAYLRGLQREHGCAVALVHHARKGASTMRAGQALRGSSEFHAWGDSNLYMRRSAKGLYLSIEHRAAASADAIALELVDVEGATALSVITGDTVHEAPPTRPACDRDRIVEQLRNVDAPVRTRPLRDLCRMRTATLTRVLTELVDDGVVEKRREGWALAASYPTPVSASP